ncbi:MAG: hypothetical protein V4667_10355 [Bacteroidota bacterium]
MKNYNSILFVALIALACFSISCKSSKNASMYSVKKLSNDEIEKSMPIPDDVNIEDISINKDEMVFIVSYRGCKSQVFDLYWNGSFAKSLPPQATVFLHTDYKSGGDCNEVITKRKIVFSIKDLKFASTNEVQINFTKSAFSYKY